MNAQQRKEIEAIKSKIEGFMDSQEMIEVGEAHEEYLAAKQKLLDARQEAAATIEQLMGEVEDQENEEQSKFDNMPEGLQGGDRGQAMEAAIEALGEAKDHLDTVKSNLESSDISDEEDDLSSDLDEAVNKLDEAAQ